MMKINNEGQLPPSGPALELVRAVCSPTIGNRVLRLCELVVWLGKAILMWHLYCKLQHHSDACTFALVFSWKGLLTTPHFTDEQIERGQFTHNSSGNVTKISLINYVPLYIVVNRTNLGISTQMQTPLSSIRLAPWKVVLDCSPWDWAAKWIFHPYCLGQAPSFCPWSSQSAIWGGLY